MSIDYPKWVEDVARSLSLEELSDPDKPWPWCVFEDDGSGTMVNMGEVSRPYWHGFVKRIMQVADAMKKHGWMEPDGSRT